MEKLIKTSSVLLSLLLVTSMLTFFSIHALSSNAVATPKILGANPGVVVLRIIPTDDTGINELFPNNNYGAIYNMYNGWNTGSGKERNYLKFDLSLLPAGVTIDNAYLYLLAKYGPSGAGGFSDATTHMIRAYVVDNDNWDETTITWNTSISDNILPNFTQGVYDNENFICNLLIPTSERAGDNLDPDGIHVWYSWNVSALIANQFVLDPYKKATIALVGQNELDNFYSAGWFYTTHAGNLDNMIPYLLVTYEAPPGGAVNVSSAPSSIDNLQGSPTYFNVVVTNTGGITENIKMTLSDNGGWVKTLTGDNLTVDNKLENMLSAESRTLRLTVNIPDAASIGFQDNVLITATSVENENVKSSSLAIVTCTDTIYPSADSWVNSGKPNDNTYGSSPLIVGSFTEGDNRNLRTFIKFRLSDIAPGKTIQSAKLTLYCSSTYGDDIDVQAREVDNDNWDEKAITWNNQPPFGAVLDTTTLSDFPIGSENTFITWEVRDYVTWQRFLGTSDNYASFLLKAAVENTSGQYRFIARQFPDPTIKPRLVITFGSVQRAVSTSISPVHRIGDNGVIENFTVTVMNKGNVTDTYTLTSTADNTTGWTRTFDSPTLTNVLPGQSVTTTLHVTIPGGAIPGVVNNIMVTATGTSITDNENCSVSVKKATSWVVAGYSPDIENYGTAVTGAGNYIYVATSNSLGTRVNFMRYDPTAGGSWTYLATPPVASPFKNGTVLAWDDNNYIYALGGGAYSDNADNSSARHYFWRYHIDNNWWENLKGTGNTDNENNTLGAQGPGDALAIRTGTDNIYAIVGNKQVGSTFWRYSKSGNTWTQLSLPTTPDTWTSTDDGCSLVWTGGDNLYAFQGQSITVDNRFYKYSISTSTWTKVADAQAGVDDGGSLIWVSGADNVYALLGGNPSTENKRDNCFYVYNFTSGGWTKLDNLPQGIADPNGPRMGRIGRYLYVWRGATNPTNEHNPVLWVYALPAPPTVLTGTASIRLATGSPPTAPFLWGIRKVRVTTNLIVYTGDNLRIRFLAQDNVTVLSENVIWSRTAPGAQTAIFTNLIVPRDNHLPYPTNNVVRVKLVLTDSTGAMVLDNIAWYRAFQDDWGTRITWIILNWASHPALQQDQLGSEISAIILGWASTPTTSDQYNFSQA